MADLVVDGITYRPPPQFGTDGVSDCSWRHRPDRPVCERCWLRRGWIGVCQCLDGGRG